MIHGFGNCGFYSLGWIGMILQLVITIGVIVGIILLIVWLVRRSAAGAVTHHPLGQLSARELLQIRYARGEITREQYLQMLSDLG